MKNIYSYTNQGIEVGWSEKVYINIRLEVWVSSSKETPQRQMSPSQQLVPPKCFLTLGWSNRICSNTWNSNLPRIFTTGWMMNKNPKWLKKHNNFYLIIACTLNYSKWDECLIGTCVWYKSARFFKSGFIYLKDHIIYVEHSCPTNTFKKMKNPGSKALTT